MINVVPELQLGCRRELKLAGLIVVITMLSFLPAAADQQLSLRNAPAPPIALPIIANGTGTFSLRLQRGHGVYINFFASWCQPCEDEARTLQQITSEFAGRDVVVIGIAELDDAKTAKRFASGHGLRYPIAIDLLGDVGADYRVTKLPLHVFIGADGIIKQYVEGGPIPAAELRAGLSEISRAP